MVRTRAEQATNRGLWIAISLAVLVAIALVFYFTLRGGGTETSYSPPAQNTESEAVTSTAAAAAVQAQAAQTHAQEAAVEASAAAAEAARSQAIASQATSNSVASTDTPDLTPKAAAAPVNSFTDDYADQTGDTRTAAHQPASDEGAAGNSIGQF